MEEKHDWHVFIVNVHNGPPLCRVGRYSLTPAIFSITFPSASSILASTTDPTRYSPHVTPAGLMLVDLRHVEI